MTSLLNTSRPPIFCPGCSHDRVVHALDESFQQLGLEGHEIVIVTDIGCSGLFDTFFNTHALHGLHGRALTYATGIKLARPELTVVTIMGDGGLGIGGAHVLSACRKNLDITLLVLNNFNYGMTGGQCSATTPVEADTSSHFLGQLEAPLDICAVAAAAGTRWVKRCPASSGELPDVISDAIGYRGFALMDITGVCPGRFSKYNRRASSLITETSTDFSHIPPPADVPDGTPTERIPHNEYGEAYRLRSASADPLVPLTPVDSAHSTTLSRPFSILFLGAAGQRINTASEVLCLAAMLGGSRVTQKSDYPITVLRGHSISEVIISPEPIHFTGITTPDLIIALADEGITRRKKMFATLSSETSIIVPDHLELPETPAQIVRLPFKAHGIRSNQSALASLSVVAGKTEVLTEELLDRGARQRFKGALLADALSLLKRCSSIQATN